MNRISIEEAISHTISDFGLHRVPDLPMQDLMGWAVRALRNIGSLNALEEVSREVQIANYIGKFPLDLQSPIRVRDMKMHTLPNNTGFRVAQEEGMVTLVYHRFAADERGYPTIPDDEPTINAITWYIAHKLCLQGIMPNKQITVQYCSDQWQWYCGQARAEGFVPTLDGWERLVNISHRMLPSQYEYDNEFASSELKEREYLGVDTINFRKDG